MTSKEIGIFIANEREKRGLSLYRLSKLSGVTIRHLHLIEDGQFDLQISTLQKILNALNKQLTIIDV